MIGDTFYYDAEVDNEAATVDTPEQVQLPTSFADIVYPVFPDLTYELSTLFAKPQVSWLDSFAGIAVNACSCAMLAAFVPSSPPSLPSQKLAVPSFCHF